MRGLAEVAADEGTPVKCDCGGTKWHLIRVDQYDAAGTVVAGADGVVICARCKSRAARTDGKMADPEDRLTR